MNAKHTAIHDGTQSEIIEYLTAPPPDVVASVLPLTLVVEAVDLCDLSRFMIPADEGDSFWVANFESEQEEECFDGVEAAIYEVTY